MISLDLRAANWARSFMFGRPRWSTPLVCEDSSRVLLLVHGFNVDDPSSAYGAISERIGDAYTHIVGVRWPGSVLVAGFLFAAGRAAKAGRLLADELGWLAERATLDIEAHSLGCAVALESVRAGLRVRNVVLANAAVDNESVEYGRIYGDAVQNVRRVLLAIDARDRVLQSAYTLAKCDQALGLRGVENPANAPKNIRVVDLTGISDGHNGAKDCAAFYAAWRELLEA